MRNTSKMTTLENRFPLLAVEHGCIISKDADITVAFEVELPELYTVTGAEYEAIHSCWCKAIKVLPDYSVVHKQDWFIKERYKPELQKDDMSFLSRSFERHFNERPYLKHTCYLYLTKTTKERNRMQSNFSTLCRGHIIPKEIQDRETAVKFMEAVEQFARILNDSGRIRLRRLSDDELAGTEKETGIIGRYLALSPGNTDCLEDIAMSAEEMRVGSNRLCLHTLSDTEDLPAAVETDYRSNGSRPTARTVACRSPPRWDCCFPATISTTSTCLSATATRSCAASRSRRGTCSRSRATAARTPSTASGSRNT